MNATERQSQGTAIYSEEAIQLPENGGEPRPISVAFLAGVDVPPHPCPLPPGEGERDGAFGEISTRPVSSHLEERFSNNSGRKSGVAAESNPVKPNQGESR